MDKLSPFVINLKDQLTDLETYQWHLDDEFFAAVQGSEIEHGDADATLQVRRTSGAFELTFRFSGVLTLICDRCLEPMQQPIEGEQTMKVKLGSEYTDDGELVTIPYEDGTLSVAWNLYEFMALEIPLRHVHPDGECEASMAEAIDQHTGSVAEGEDEPETDPRWDALKKILDNN